MLHRLIAQGSQPSRSLSRVLRDEVGGQEFDRLDVAVAYATMQGVKALELAVGGAKPESRWVIGLDDAITQPEALEYLSRLPGASVRVATMTPQRRFHPKLYQVWSAKNESLCVSAIGSGNMTLNGLRHNGEAAVVFIAQSKNDTRDLRAQWNALWGLGKTLTGEILEEYKKSYKFSRKQRQKMAEAGISPKEPRATASVEEEPYFDGKPASAKLAWLDAGSAPAGGRDLEFPRFMMPFFALGKSPSRKVFEADDGQRFPLTFTERKDNDMWRLLLSTAAVTAATGRANLRPLAGGNRSDLAVVFTKAGGGVDYKLSIIPIGGPRYNVLLAKSKAANGHFKTPGANGRNFGFI